MRIQKSYDVIVAGAGIAGVCAAVKAARHGASTLLIERYAFAGGMSTAGMVSPFMKYTVKGEPLVKGVFEEIESEMRKQDGMIDNGFYASAFRSAAFNLLIAAGANIMFNSEICEVKNSDEHITSVTILQDGRRNCIEGKIFIDTTGDAQLVYTAGFPWVKGDENSGHMQAMTLFFRMGGINVPRAIEYVKNHKDDYFSWMSNDFDLTKIISVAGYFSFVKRAIAEKRLSEDIQYIFYTTLPQSGEASFNSSNILGLDGSSSYDLTLAEVKGREQVHQIVNLLQDEIPGFENSYLLETAVQIGVRETRRAVGDYIMNGAEIKNSARFEDAIARGCYGVDIHGQKDEKSRDEQMPDGIYYDIPLRSLIVKDADNLLVAGRCISATREAHSALRIMATSAATGEACGALAALAVKQDKVVREVDYNELKKLISHNVG